MRAIYRVKEHGNAYVPQKKIFFWWKNLSAPLASLDAARRIIHERAGPPKPPPAPRPTADR